MLSKEVLDCVVLTNTSGKIEKLTSDLSRTSTVCGQHSSSRSSTLIFTTQEINVSFDKLVTK